MNTPPPVITSKGAAPAPPQPPVPGRRTSKAAPVAPEMVARSGSRVVLLRAGMFLMLAASVGLVWWSVTRRLMPTSRELKEKAIAMTMLANEVQQLELNKDACTTSKQKTYLLQPLAMFFTTETRREIWSTLRLYTSDFI